MDPESKRLEQEDLEAEGFVSDDSEPLSDNSFFELNSR